MFVKRELSWCRIKQVISANNMADGTVDVINHNGELVCVKSILTLDDEVANLLFEIPGLQTKAAVID